MNNAVDVALTEIIYRVVSLFLLLPICISFFNLTWLQILVAPKIFLIEYAAGLIK